MHKLNIVFFIHPIFSVELNVLLSYISPSFLPPLMLFTGQTLFCSRQPLMLDIYTDLFTFYGTSINCSGHFFPTVWPVTNWGQYHQICCPLQKLRHPIYSVSQFPFLSIWYLYFHSALPLFCIQKWGGWSVGVKFLLLHPDRRIGSRLSLIAG